MQESKHCFIHRFILPASALPAAPVTLIAAGRHRSSAPISKPAAGTGAFFPWIWAELDIFFLLLFLSKLFPRGDPCGSSLEITGRFQGARREDALPHRHAGMLTPSRFPWGPPLPPAGNPFGLKIAKFVFLPFM